jgi:dolichol-phosphate mannosyltransferase
VGVADSYDGPRLMCHLNVDMHLAQGAERLREFVTFRYDMNHKASCAAGHLGSISMPHVPYRSSQLLTLYAGRGVTRLLGLPGYLDLRAVGLVSCVLIGGAIGLLYWALAGPWLLRLLVCAALVLVVADPIFIDFAVSPFSEIAAVVGGLFVLPGVLLLAQGGRRRLAGLCVTVLGGAFLITAKTQDAVVVVPLAVLLCAFRMPISRGTALVRRIDRRLRHRLLPATGVAVLALCLVTVGGAKQDRKDGMLTMGNFVTASILPAGDDPRGDLRALGGSDWLAELAGKPVWCASAKDMGNPDYKRFLSGLSHQRIALFLAARPGRIPQILDGTAERFYDPRPGFTVCSLSQGVMTSPKLANYGRADGAAPNSLDDRLTPVTGPLGLLQGTGFAPLAALWITPAAGALFVIRRHRHGRAGTGEAVATVLLVTVAILQFGVCAFGDGIDTSKHLDLAVFATACAWVTGATAVLLSRVRGFAASSGPPPRASDTAESLLENA